MKLKNFAMITEDKVSEIFCIADDFCKVLLAKVLPDRNSFYSSDCCFSHHNVMVSAKKSSMSKIASIFPWSHLTLCQLRHDGQQAIFRRAAVCFSEPLPGFCVVLLLAADSCCGVPRSAVGIPLRRSLGQ